MKRPMTYVEFCDFLKGLLEGWEYKDANKDDALAWDYISLSEECDGGIRLADGNNNVGFCEDTFFYCDRTNEPRLWVKSEKLNSEEKYKWKHRNVIVTKDSHRSVGGM